MVRVKVGHHDIDVMGFGDVETMALVREIVLDTETTGLDPIQGDRLVEIGCVELVNHIVTGRNLHLYINPQRDMPEEAYRIHGLSIEFLSKYPTFDKQVDDFINFIADSPLVIHNARFDMKFLNAELRWLNRPEIPINRAIDTLAIARKKFPGAPASLDSLCRRFGIDNSNRTLHGALLDSELLADVYLELIGGKQPGFSLSPTPLSSSTTENSDGTFNTSHESSQKKNTVRPPRAHGASAIEQKAHDAFIAQLKDPIWAKYK